MSDRLIRTSNQADFLALSAHLLCCGVPTLAALLSLLSTAGLTGSLLVTQLDAFAERWHLAAFILSTIMVLVALAAFVISRRRDCVKEGACAHEPCAPKKQIGYKRLLLSLALYGANLAVFLFG